MSGTVGQLARPARGGGGRLQIGCTLPEVFGSACVGQKILFDDGQVGGRITAVGCDTIEVRIERAAESGSKLGAGKGINLPDTALPVSALTDKDVADLATAAVVLDDILRRMAEHHYKKNALLPQLHSWHPHRDEGLGSSNE